jgi:hypothetical protein
MTSCFSLPRKIVQGAVAKLLENIFFHMNHAEKDESSYRIIRPWLQFCNSPLNEEHRKGRLHNE